MRHFIILFFIPTLLFSQSKKEIIANHEQTIKRLNIIIQEKNEIISNKSAEINRVISEKKGLEESLSAEKKETKNLILEVNETNKIIDSLSIIIESLSEEIEYFKLQKQGSSNLSLLDSIYDGDYIISNQKFNIILAGMYYNIGEGRKSFLPIEKLNITKINSFNITSGYTLLDLEKYQVRTLSEHKRHWDDDNYLHHYFDSNCAMGWEESDNGIKDRADQLDCYLNNFYRKSYNQSISLGVNDLSSESVISGAICPVEIEFTKSKFASLIIDKDSITDYMFEIKKDNKKDGFDNNVFTFDFTQDGETDLSIPLVVHEDKCYLAMNLNDVGKYFSISFSAGGLFLGESKYLITNYSEYNYDYENKGSKKRSDEFYCLKTYNSKNNTKVLIHPGEEDLFLFELIEIE